MRTWLIVGGGIAGLSATLALARRGQRPLLLEREPWLASHASGRNAAIFRTPDLSPAGAELALRSRALLDGVFAASDEQWLAPVGALYAAASDTALAPYRASLARLGIPSADHPNRPLAALEGGRLGAWLFVPGDGVIDIHAVTTALARAARAAGATIETKREVIQIERRGARVAGVRLASGESIDASNVLIAAGAWSRSLGETVDAPLPLLPFRRHLALLDAAPFTRVDDPVVWALDDEVYFRPESGGLLCSPCDETISEPGIPVDDPGAIELLAEKLARAAPPLAKLGVRRHWACLRTFAPDRGMVIGADPRVEGLFWLSGLGGHGMTAGVAAGEMLAMAATEEGAGLPELSLSRFFR